MLGELSITWAMSSPNLLASNISYNESIKIYFTFEITSRSLRNFYWWYFTCYLEDTVIFFFSWYVKDARIILWVHWYHKRNLSYVCKCKYNPFQLIFIKFIFIRWQFLTESINFTDTSTVPKYTNFKGSCHCKNYPP